MDTMYLSLLLLFPSLSFCEQNYHVEMLHGQIGLYYDKLGDAKIINSKFTLLTHLNLSNYNEKLNSISEIYEGSNNLCSKDETSDFDRIYCKNTLNIIKTRITKLYEKDSIINDMLGHNKPREKRGIFNGASYAFNWLFGIPDVDDAKFYEESIKSLLNGNRETQILMKQHVGIISNTIQNFNSSIQDFKINEATLNKNIKLFNMFANQTSKELLNSKLKLKINSHLNLLMQLLEDLNEEYDLLISSVTLAKHNILHPKVISPKNLLKELSQISLHSDQNLPLLLSYATIHKYFEISELKVLHTKEIIIFSISIPLVGLLKYDLFKLLPLPIPHNNSNLYSYIEPSFPYVLISTSKVYYVQMQELSKCTKVTQEDFICKGTQTIRIQEHPICEILLHTSIIKQIPIDCQTRTVMADFEIWHSLGGNTWLFVISNPIPLTLSCKTSQVEDIQIQSTGLLTLAPYCKGYTQTTTLEAFSMMTSNITNDILGYNIALDDCCLTKQIKLNVTSIKLEPVRITNLKLDELQFATHKLGQLDKILNQELNKPFIVEHTHWYTLGLSLIASIMGIVIIYNLLKWCGVFQILRNCLCFTKEPKRPSDSCCVKLFNFNTTSPVTRVQLSQLMEEERMRNNEAVSSLPLESTVQPFSTTTGLLELKGRRSTRKPSVNME